MVCSKKQKKIIKNPNTYESKNWNTNDKNSNVSKRKFNSLKKESKNGNFVNKIQNSDSFNEVEFNNWLTMHDQENHSLNSTENEEFDNFISGTYFSNNNLNENNKIDDSPSYSPLESINNEFIYSQVIELDKHLEEKLKTGIERTDRITIDSYIESIENLHIKDNKIEIVLESDDESPWYDLSPSEIISDYVKNFQCLKINKLTSEKIEKNNKLLKQIKFNNETSSEDYLSRFSESLEIVKEMLDIIETQTIEINLENKENLNGASRIEDSNSNFSGESEENSKIKFKKKSLPNVQSSITITKLKRNPSFNNLKASICLPIQNNEIFLKLNYYQIEAMFIKLIQNCQEKLMLNYQNDLDIDLVKKLAQNNLKKECVSWYLILEFCLQSLDLLFNCSWSNFMRYTKNFLNNFRYKPGNYLKF